MFRSDFRKAIVDAELNLDTDEVLSTSHTSHTSDLLNTEWTEASPNATTQQRGRGFEPHRSTVHGRPLSGSLTLTDSRSL
jgi:hypothetical protein